jgi:hypothetical protein
MPSSFDLNTSNASAPVFRSNKRIRKLVGKQQEGPVTRSRLASKDFTTSDDWSSFTTLQELKRRKKNRLDDLKHNDMFLMSA